jgi:hypothetical protein
MAVVVGHNTCPPDVILPHYCVPPVTKHTVERGSSEQQQASCVGMQPQTACKEGQDEQYPRQIRQAALLRNPREHVWHHSPQLYASERLYEVVLAKKLPPGLQHGMARGKGPCSVNGFTK